MTPTQRNQGFSLAELAVALLLGTLVVAALLRVLGLSLDTLRMRDDDAALQENLRYALATLESELSMAGFYGLSADGSSFRFLRNGGVATAVETIPASAQVCGDNFVANLAQPVQADDGVFTLGAHRSASCNARGGAQAGSDTLTIRRASSMPTAAESGRLQLLVDRFDDQGRFIVADGVLPATAMLQPDRLQLHNLELHSYYISNDSDGRPGFPALRVKTLTRIAGRPSFTDTEVMAGVEDLQLQWQTSGSIVRAVQVSLRARSGITAATPRSLTGSRLIALRNVPFS